jgi:hypothetical protein
LCFMTVQMYCCSNSGFKTKHNPKKQRCSNKLKTERVLKTNQILSNLI